MRNSITGFILGFAADRVPDRSVASVRVPGEASDYTGAALSSC